jgi:murein DD-endopeptidase MepM/ murein hydrolase activator NlpD
MSPADDVAADQSAVERDGLEALRRLAVKGAYAVPVETGTGAGGDFAVFSPRNDFAQALATIAAATFDWCRRRGWLAPEQTTGRYRIAKAGIKALRRAMSGAQPAAVPKVRAQSQVAQPAKKAKAPAAAASGGPTEGSLAWLRRRRDKDGQPLVTDPQFAAGERLGADFWHAQLSPRVTADWSGTASSRRTPRAAPGAGIELHDRVLAARQRVHRALDAVGPELARILVEVCCRDVGLEAAGRAQGWPQRAAKVVLQLALTGLARHYGLLAPEPRPGPHRLRHWGSDDYRPDLDSWR